MRRASRTLFVYILGESAPLFALSFLVLTTLIAAQQMSRSSTLSVLGLASVEEALKILLYTLPSICLITLPMGLLMGLLMALNRLKADQELTAAAAAGIGPAGLYSAIVALGVIIGCVAYGITFFAAPRAAAASIGLRAQVFARGLSSRIKPHSFETAFPSHLLQIRDIEPATGDWRGVFLLRQQDDEQLLLTADRGRMRIVNDSPSAAPKLEIELIDGVSFTHNESAGRRDGAVFDRALISLEASHHAGADQPGLTLRVQALGVPALAALARSGSAEERRTAQIEIHRRWSLPLASPVLALLAILIAMRTQKARSKAIGLALGFAISMLYYLCLIAGQNLSVAGRLPPWIGVWAPNLIAMAAMAGSGLLRTTKFPAVAMRTPSRLPALPRQSSHRTRIVFIRPTALVNYLILSEVLRIFCLGSAVLVSTTLIFTLFDIIPAAARSGISTGYIAAYLTYLSPQIFYYIAPFALLIAVIAACFILARSNQLTVLGASGLSSFRISLPVIALGTAAAVLLFALSEIILPISNREQDERYQTIKGRRNDTAAIALGRKWLTVDAGRIIGFLYSQNDKRLLNTTVYEINPSPRRLSSIRWLSEAVPVEGTRWRVVKGWEFQPAAGAYSELRDSVIDIGESPSAFVRTVNESSKLSSRQLGSYLEQLRRLGAVAYAERIDLWKRYSHPAACLTLLLVSWPLAASSRTRTRREGLAGIGYGITISLAFWLLSQALEFAGKQSLLPVWIASWGGHILALPLAIYLYVRRL